MQSFKQHRQHLLRVMLCKASELTSFHGDNTLDIPRSQTSMGTEIHFLHEFCENDDQLASSAIVILLIDLCLIKIQQKVLCQWFCICQALKHTVHEARVPEVLETYQSSTLAWFQEFWEVTTHLVSVVFINLLLVSAHVLQLLILWLLFLVCAAVTCWHQAPCWLSSCLTVQFDFIKENFIVGDVNVFNELVLLKNLSMHRYWELPRVSSSGIHGIMDFLGTVVAGVHFPDPWPFKEV